MSQAQPPATPRATPPIPYARQILRERQRAADCQWRARHPARAAIEDAIARENAIAHAEYGRKANGTHQTHHRAARLRQGSIARLYEAGYLSLDQLAWSQEIAQVHTRITAGVHISSMSLETRVDESRGGGFGEAIGAVWAEMAYTRWRAALRQPTHILAVITGEASCRSAARKARMRDATMRAMLSDALDLWPSCFEAAQARVDAAELLAAHAAIFG